MMKKKMEIRSLPISMNSVSNDGKLTVSGLVNGAGSVSEILHNPVNGKEFRETISKGVFANAVANSDRIDFLSQHDKTLILSTTENNSLELRETDNGLEMNASITETSWGRDTFQLIKDGIIKGMSFGMRVLSDSWTIASDNIPMRTINGIELFEVSAVRNPAYKSSDIEARDIDVINDVNIPDEIEERSKDMTETESQEPKAEVEKETQAEVQKETEKETQEPKKEITETEEQREEPETESETEPEEKRSEDEEVKVTTVDEKVSQELRSLIDSALTEISAVRSELGSLKSELAKKEEVRSIEASENKKFFETR